MRRLLIGAEVGLIGHTLWGIAAQDPKDAEEAEGFIFDVFSNICNSSVRVVLTSRHTRSYNVASAIGYAGLNALSSERDSDQIDGVLALTLADYMHGVGAGTAVPQDKIIPVLADTVSEYIGQFPKPEGFTSPSVDEIEEYFASASTSEDGALDPDMLKIYDFFIYAVSRIGLSASADPDSLISKVD